MAETRYAEHSKRKAWTGLATEEQRLPRVAKEKRREASHRNGKEANRPDTRSKGIEQLFSEMKRKSGAENTTHRNGIAHSRREENAASSHGNASRSG